MGYFTTNMEQEEYQQEHCAKCIHGQDGDCPVMTSQFPLLLHSEFIPHKDGHNQACKMFAPVAAGGMKAFAAIRKSEFSGIGEFIDYDSITRTEGLVKAKIKRDENQHHTWNKKNPVLRIVPVTITEVE